MSLLEPAVSCLLAAFDARIKYVVDDVRLDRDFSASCVRRTQVKDMLQLAGDEPHMTPYVTFVRYHALCDEKLGYL